jgi:hypothetical protein
MHAYTCLIQQALIKDGQCTGLKIGFIFHMQLWFFWKNDFPFAWLKDLGFKTLKCIIENLEVFV